MTHVNEKNLCAVLDRIVSLPKLGPAMRAIGADEKLIFRWLRKSAEGDSAFLVHWLDKEGDPIQFVDAVKLARKMHLVKLDASIREDVERGTPRTVIQDGKVCWTEDEALSKYTDQQILDMHELGAVDFPDRYKRDADGNRIPLTVYEPAPTALRVHAIKSLMPKAYNPTEVREVKNTTSVLVVGANKPRSEASEGESALVRDLRLRILELEKNGSSHPRPTAPVGVLLRGRSVSVTFAQIILAARRFI